MSSAEDRREVADLNSVTAGIFSDLNSEAAEAFLDSTSARLCSSAYDERDSISARGTEAMISWARQDKK
jgi:hypothetical protein